MAVLLTAEPASRLVEAEAAAAILDVQIRCLGLRDGGLWEQADLVPRLRRCMDEFRPDRIYTHWPLDAHPDHQACGMATFRAWLQLSGSDIPRLFCYEVVLGNQTTAFSPTHYVNVTEFTEPKKRALFCHASQRPDETFYPTHEAMMKLRGLECGCETAEAFVEVFRRPVHARERYMF